MAVEGLSFMYPLFPIVGTITIVLCMIPVLIHWRVGNIAVVSIALWISIGLLICVIDTTVWHGNVRNPYPIWGDIVQVYFAILGPAVASGMLTVQYRLWSVARIKSVYVTKREKLMQNYLTIFLCFGVPFLIGILHYIVQGHRYNLWEDIGPLAEIYNTWAAIPVYYMWEPLICLISAIFGMHTIALFLARRKELDVALDSGSIKINKNRYIRLMALAAVTACIHLPISSWFFILNAAVYPVYPWISWEDTHSNYHRIQYVTRFMAGLERTPMIALSVEWFSLVLSGMLFFMFFGFGEEANRQYRSTYNNLCQLFGMDPSLDKKQKAAKRSWMDVLFCRPGRSVDTTSTSSIPQFTVDARMEQGRISIDTQISETSGNVDIDRRTQLGRVGPSAGEEISRTTDTSISEKVHYDERVNKRLASTSAPDAEANRAADTTIGQRRRQEILEMNPDLTEEVTF